MEYGLQVGSEDIFPLAGSLSPISKNMDSNDSFEYTRFLNESPNNP